MGAVRVRAALRGVRAGCPALEHGAGEPRWSYNRKRADGTSAQDARKPDGSAWTRKEILADLAAALHGAPEVSRAPAEFEGAQGGAELVPGSAALEGLAELVRRWGLTEPCLDLDGRLSFWRMGEGEVGTAPNGAGANSDPIPPELLLDKAGTGYGHRIEFGHPPEHVLVFGGPRVATVAIDGWTPVLHVDNQFLPLTEELQLQQAREALSLAERLRGDQPTEVREQLLVALADYLSVIATEQGVTA